MNLSAVLDGYTSDALGAMLRVWDPNGGKRVTIKSERLRALVGILSDPAQVGVAQWSDGERAVLALLWRMEPRRLAPLGAMGRAQGVEDVDRVLETLLACGAILCPEPGWGSKLSAQDILKLHDAPLVFAPGIVQAPRLDPPAPLRLEPVPPERIRATRAGRGAETAAQLLAFVALAGRKKLRVTKAGLLSTPTVDAITRELGGDFLSAEWLLQLSVAGGLVEVRDGALRPVPDLPLARLGLGGLLAAVFEGFLERVEWRDDIDLDAREHGGTWSGHAFEAARLARPVLYGLLARLEPRGWVRVDDLVDAVLAVEPLLGVRSTRRSYDRPSIPVLPSDRRRQREFGRGAYVHAAWRLGLVDIGSTADTWYRRESRERDHEYNSQFRVPAPYARPGSASLPDWAPPPCDLCLRLTPLGRRILGLEAEAPQSGVVTGLHVGIDFEIVAPVAGTPPSLLFRLDLAARAVPSGPGDPVRRWRLGREPWLAALQGGLDGTVDLAPGAEPRADAGQHRGGHPGLVRRAAPGADAGRGARPARRPRGGRGGGGARGDRPARRGALARRCARAPCGRARQGGEGARRHRDRGAGGARLPRGVTCAAGAQSSASGGRHTSAVVGHRAPHARRWCTKGLPMLLVPLLAVGCAPATDGTAIDDPVAPWTAPDEEGPYAVSATTLAWTDDRGQALVAEVWYPVDACNEPEPYPELPFTGDACRDAPATQVGGPFPLIAFSHGNAGIRYQSIFLTEALARHGFVVVAVDHPHNTLLDMDGDRMGEVALRRPGDVVASVDEVFRRSATGDPLLGGLVQPDRYGMAGHSFGGWTTLAVAGGVPDFDALRTFCAADDAYDLCGISDQLPDGATIASAPDPRAVVALPMAPAGWYSFGEAGLDPLVPTLLFGGSRDESETIEREIQPLYDRLPAPKALGILEGAGHYAFSDICLLGDIQDECSEAEGGYIELDVAHAIVNARAAAWFGWLLAGDARNEPYVDTAYPELGWTRE